MKTFILSFLIILTANELIGQTDVLLRRVVNDEIVSVGEIMAEGAEVKPTFIITWSGKWCSTCMTVISSFGEAAKSGVIKLIAVNIDDEEWDSVKSFGYHNSHWRNATNLYLDSDLTRSFDTYFSVNQAPLILYYSTEGAIEYMQSSESTRAWMFTGYFGKELIWDSSSELNSYSWNYFEKHEDEGLISTEDEAMNEALEIIQRSLKLEKRYENTDTYAALLYLSGQYNKALKVAKEAVDIAKTNRYNYASTNDLIQKIIGKM